MFTPQQIEQISFSKATFGGYDIDSVDEFLEPLTEDYITLYKENGMENSIPSILAAVSSMDESFSQRVLPKLQAFHTAE